jgi:hypothetical protein
VNGCPTQLSPNWLAGDQLACIESKLAGQRTACAIGLECAQAQGNVPFVDRRGF